MIHQLSTGMASEPIASPASEQLRQPTIGIDASVKPLSDGQDSFSRSPHVSNDILTPNEKPSHTPFPIFRFASSHAPETPNSSTPGESDGVIRSLPDISHSKGFPTPIPESGKAVGLVGSETLSPEMAKADISISGLNRI